MHKYAKIVKDCVAYYSKDYNDIKCSIQLLQDEIFEVLNYYKHYKGSEDIEFWNSEHPVIGIRELETGEYLTFELQPETYEIIKGPIKEYILPKDEIFSRTNYFHEEDLAKELEDSYKRNYDPLKLFKWMIDGN